MPVVRIDPAVVHDLVVERAQSELDVLQPPAELAVSEDPLLLHDTRVLVDEEAVALAAVHRRRDRRLRVDDRRRREHEARGRDCADGQQLPCAEALPVQKAQPEQEQDPDREDDARRVVDVEPEAGHEPAEEDRELLAVAQAPDEQDERDHENEHGRVLAHREPADHEHRVVDADEEGAEERPSARKQEPEEHVAAGDRQQPDDGVQEPHVEQVDPADQLAELAPDDEQARGPGQVVAVSERIAAVVRVLLRHAHDRDLVRADLNRPAIERDQVERRAQSRHAGREADVENGDPRPDTRSQSEPDRGDRHAGEPEPEHPVAVAADDVDQQRQSPEHEPERDEAERNQLLERAAPPGKARIAHGFLSDDPHERQRVASCEGKVLARFGSDSTHREPSA